MITFGITGSVFDYLTFGTLLLLLPRMTEEFRTGWFIESVVSASMIVLVVRSRKPVFRSRPGKYLLAATLLIETFTLGLPLTPLAALVGFKPLPLSVILIIGAIVRLYVLTAEVMKRIFYKGKTLKYFCSKTLLLAGKLKVFLMILFYNHPDFQFLCNILLQADLFRRAEKV